MTDGYLLREMMSDPLLSKYRYFSVMYLSVVFGMFLFGILVV